jgi:hypothetical protein
MGLLFTSEGTRRIKNTLNTAFDDSPNGLAFIRSFATPPIPATPTSPAVPAGPIYDMVAGRNWNPTDLATALDLQPYDQGSGSGENPTKPQPIKDRDTRRWNYFLSKLPKVVFAPLRNALAGAILNQDDNGNTLSYSIIRVCFDHLELDDANANPYLVVFDAPLPGTTGNVRNITLFTPSVPKGKVGNDCGKPVISGQHWHT